MIRLRPITPNRALTRPSRWPVVVLLLAALCVADREGWLLAKRLDDLSVYHGRTLTVVHIVSGDVIEVDAADTLRETATTQVRLWGVVAPQPPRPGREPEPGWEEAIQRVESLVLGREVVLRLETHRLRDPQGTLLAHAEMVDGGTINEALLREGMARRDERWPHAMLTPYAQAENWARRRGEGMWAR